MPSRPSSHVIADQATSAVAGVIANCGHASERVLNDYGEDLLVQTSHAGQMDASRLWLQVKGTRSIERHALKRGGYSFSVDVDQALRWVRSADLVAFVLWDVELEKGFYTLPRTSVDEAILAGTSTKSITVPLQETHAFDEPAFRRLVWESRFHHYGLLLLQAVQLDMLQSETAADPTALLPAHHSSSLAIDFLVLIGLASSSGTSPESFFVTTQAHSAVTRTFAKLASEAPFRDGPPSETAIAAATLVILRQVAGLEPGLGISRAVAEPASNTLLALLGLGIEVREAFDAI